MEDISQRINLLERTARKSGSVPVLPLSPPASPVGKSEELSLRILNRDIMDVGFTDEPIQCEADLCEFIKETYTYKGRKDWVSTNKCVSSYHPFTLVPGGDWDARAREGLTDRYKYLLDVDGNGWSARFKRQMSTNSLVLKSTIFPEWYNDRIQPCAFPLPPYPPSSHRRQEAIADAQGCTTFRSSPISRTYTTS